MSQVHVVGGTLAGVATALRLAKVGHQVSLDPAGPLGGRAHGRRLESAPDTTVDDLEPVLTLPAAWRDLLKKSGRPFTAELARHHLELVPAPPAVHRWPDGTELELPDDRGGQLRALREAFGEPAARRWTKLFDQVDELWQGLRMAGVERPFPAEGMDADRTTALWGRRTLGQLAKELREPHLADLLLSAGWRAGARNPEKAPAWLATRWTVPRTFGRWHLASGELALPVSALMDVLTDRLAERGVDLEPTSSNPGQVVIDARPPVPPLRRITLMDRWRGRQVHPLAVRPPRVGHDLHEDLPAVEGITESVFHSGQGTMVGWQRSTPAGVLVTSHDHGHPTEADPAHGWDLSSWERWVGRPPLEPEQDGGPWRASAASHAGNEPWAELMSGALVTYLVHEQLTGEDIRPTNKALNRRTGRPDPVAPDSA